ncbi:hypothetical protein DFJ63DRAFT_311894 [Scheffersomyces coipomensis]|uniref:uncharacterized protein n=1 Tax=Scheffersomyces coipomensis TaxID=1788519 RepID=UPI00315D1CF0
MDSTNFNMEDYVDFELLYSSIDFIIDKTKNGARYNVFVDYDDCEEEWNKRIIAFPNHDSITLQRLKLSFRLTKFHIIPVNRHSCLELDDSYLSSENYINDYDEICNLIDAELTGNLHNKYSSYPGTLLVRLWHLHISYSLHIPIPVKKFTPKNNYTGRNPSILNVLHLVKPYYPKISTVFSTGDYKTFELDTNSIKKCLFSRSKLIGVDKEVEVSHNAYRICFEPIHLLLKAKFQNVTFKNQDNETSNVIPDHSYSILKDYKTYKVPIEVKTSGLYDAFKNDEEDFKQFVLQSTYQMISTRSGLGILLDPQTIVILRISNQNFDENQNCKLTNNEVGFDVECYNHSSTQSLTAILGIILNDYFTEVDEIITQRMEDLNSNLKKTQAQIQKEDDERYATVEQIWSDINDIFVWNDDTKSYAADKTKLTKYFSKDDKTKSYIHKKINLQIPDKYFNYLLSMSSPGGSIDFKDFNITRIIQGGTNLQKYKYHAQVFIVDYMGEADKEKSQIILKIYNPVFAARDGIDSQKATFLQTLSFSLSMFATEVHAYELLRDRGPEGIKVAKLESAGAKNKNGHINFVPHVYEYGFLNWESPKVGFYILEEYIKPDNVKSKEEALKLARTALEYIHSKGVLHGDIRRSNLIFGNGRCYIIDFGFSRFKKFFKDERDKKVQYEMNQEMDRLVKVIEKSVFP